jgi:LPXTG-motif cell wall-anchored protein
VEDRNITKNYTIEKTKVSEKNNNANLWIGLFAVLVAGIIIYLKIK